jgi:hypothetical protein
MKNVVPQWKQHPAANILVEKQLDALIKGNPDLSRLRDRLKNETGTRLRDYVDYLVFSGSSEILDEFKECGFVEESPGILFHPAAIFPKIYVNNDDAINQGVAVRVDSIGNFLVVNGYSHPIEGTPFSRFRRCKISSTNGVMFWVVERGWGFDQYPVNKTEDYLYIYLRALEKWQTRPRFEGNDDESFEKTLQLADEVITEVGQDMGAYLFFLVERWFWKFRNTGAGFLKPLLDKVGVGWACHDHHTFRSSRKHFSCLIRFFKKLGFHLREKFYAGQDAGWGAQVMENPTLGITLFLDVDLKEDELEIHFEKDPLPELDTLGTVGLWCGLHGDSILQSGLHHLAVRSDFLRLREIFETSGVKQMPPFSAFSYLMQAFTVGDTWAVDPERVSQLRERGLISNEAARRFVSRGAVGSHLELIQRGNGYKGFSQKEVSSIIKATDPRASS